MYNKLIQKQPMMRRVLLSLLPIYAFALYLYGLHLVFLTLVVFPLGLGMELLFERRNKKKATEAVFVTCMLYLLSLPPLVPLWIAGVGILFAVFIAKEIFGGFGRNVFNPAIAGRLFVYITFSPHMTTGWLSAGNFGIDAVSTATPLHQAAGQQVDLLHMVLGFRPGSMGESPIILILLAAVFLVVTKTAKARIMLSTVGSAAVLMVILKLLQVPNAMDILPGLLAGSLLFVAVFMATDPVSAPKKAGSQVVYGILIGAVVVLIRLFPLFTEGTSFAVLLGNTFAPLLDQVFTRSKA